MGLAKTLHFLNQRKRILPTAAYNLPGASVVLWRKDRDNLLMR